jgi:uncharacterized protein YyaL (SSP411 family)
MERIPNALIHSSSPYLLQHAYNPVQWFPWGEEALKKARDENKLLIISVGYSSCHWCHVMEHESFEDEEVATVMNKSFVCVKVDREERPDIDQIYMDAVQLMTQRGGWPLNVIALPDQRPIYGGTYFPKEQWRNVLLQLAAFWRNDPAKCNEYAEELTEGMQRLGKVAAIVDDGNRSFPDISDMLDRWSRQWDQEEGGHLRAPKFPMPDSLRYLLAAAEVTGNTAARNHVLLTLKKMALGGINDQIGGGFARYSTDMIWKVPHFEKMLYDNAQLISLYADAYKLTGDPLWLEVVNETMQFIAREMTSPAGGFYSALDADSEGVEGKFYCWNPDEIFDIFGDEAPLVIRYFNINEKGYWEHDFYIPLRETDDATFAKQENLDVEILKQNVLRWKRKLLEMREHRVRPGLDYKILCSWNALMLAACFDAFAVSGDARWKQMGETNLDFLLRHFLTGDGRLLHTAHETQGRVTATIDGFLEDYAFVIEALLKIQAFLPERNLLPVAEKLINTTLRDFVDESSGFFWFTGQLGEQLVTRRQEVQDNVIPSSNAVMSHNLLRWSRLSGDMTNENRVLKCLRTLRDDISRSTPWYSRWAMVWLELEHGSEVEVYGESAHLMMSELLKAYLPLTVFSAHQTPDHSPLTGVRYREGETLAYVCRNRSCHAPVMDAEQAIHLASFH